MVEMVDEASVVVIGGGVVGCSIAYHLAARGWNDVVLVDKNDLTSGATWHAAGLVGQLRASRNVTRMIQYSVDLYGRLESETGQPTGWNPVGSLRLASSRERLQELQRIATAGRAFGLDVQLLTPAEALALCPILNIDGVVGAAYLESDGHADPSMLTLALARGARNRGATIIKHNRVTGFDIRRGAVTAVRTEKGTIRCDHVINAAGMWARRLGAMAGVNVPVVPLQHQFLVTEPIPQLAGPIPITRDPDNRIYYRAEVGGLVTGGFEESPLPWALDGVPWDFASELLEANFEQFEPLSERAIFRAPCLEAAGVRKLVNGPDGYSPDGAYVLGRAPELGNYYVAAGMNCYGIAGAGGVGKAMAEWLVDGRPELDIHALDIRRFGGAQYRSRDFVAVRSLEYYPKHYSIAWPMYDTRTGRGVRRSPLHSILRARRAVFGEKNGWERVNWFAPEGVEPRETMTFDQPCWHEAVAGEVRAIREGVALLDQTSFGKIEVRGAAAFERLQYLATRDLESRPGSVAYTQMCNERGGIECDLTIACLREDLFYIVTGTSFAGHDLDWIRRHLPADGSVVAHDVTSSRAVITVCGPRSRELLAAVSHDDFTNDGFPFGTARAVHIRYAPALALRVGYHGELGWELHIATEYGAFVYETLAGAGETLGVADVGYRALESCRLEKGYCYWSTDVTPDHNPYEAGLGFNVALGKGDFLGREALLEAKETGPAQKRCLFTLDEPVQLFGSEPISRGGKVLGIVTSGGFGHTIGKTIAYGYLPSSEAHHDEYLIDAFGVEIGAKRHERALHDPQRKRNLA